MFDVYLAGPYSGTEEEEGERFEVLTAVTEHLMQVGLLVFSPVTSSHPVGVRGMLPRKHEFWMAYDLPVLRMCREVWVVCLPGWEASKGVGEEVKEALRLGKVVRFLPVVEGMHVCGVAGRAVDACVRMLREGKGAVDGEEVMRLEVLEELGG